MEFLSKIMSHSLVHTKYSWNFCVRSSENVQDHDIFKVIIIDAANDPEMKKCQCWKPSLQEKYPYNSKIKLYKNIKKNICMVSSL